MAEAAQLKQLLTELPDGHPERLAVRQQLVEKEKQITLLMAAAAPAPPAGVARLLCIILRALSFR